MDFYIARQPIFDLNNRVFGYELLYRSGAHFGHEAVDGDVKTMEVISNCIMLFGLEQMTRGRRAFINFTPNLLEQETADILPPDRVVIEILEGTEPSQAVLEACRRLKHMGYTLALDDFVYERRSSPFLEVADIIKVDFRRSLTMRERAATINIPRRKPLQFLAEKVETREEVEMALRLGYAYFQGYFFERPVLLVARDIPPAKHTYFQLLQEVNRPEPDIELIERHIQTDPLLTVKLLRFINSAAFSIKNQISSVRQALVLLGPKELRKWIALVVMHGIATDKTDELIVLAVSRAFQCEQLTPLAGLERPGADLFLLGLLSLIDAMLDLPMEQLTAELALEPELAAALNGWEGQLKDILDMVSAYEKGDWSQCQDLWARYGIDGERAGEIYLQSLDFVNEMLE